MSNWEDFVEECRSCEACELCGTRTNVVVSRGAVPAPLMIIGEGPGADEDAQGLPFVGRSGRLLQYLLEAHSLDEKMYHVGNIVKCRPPDNRKPTLHEATQCRRLLDKQVELVQPKIILLLGASAYSYFTGDNSAISNIRGKMQTFHDYLLMPTFHPAYALRNPKMKEPMWEDVALLKRTMQEMSLI